MVKGKVLNESPTNTAEVKALLVEIKERDKELNFRAQKTLDYLEQSGTLGVKEAQKLFKKLQELNVPRLREQHINKLIDTMPITAKDVKVVLQGYAITVTNENMQKIADVIAEFKK